MATLTAEKLAELQAAQAAADIAYVEETADARHVARAAAEQWTWALSRWVADPLNEYAEAEVAAKRDELDKADVELRKVLAAGKGKRTKALAAAGIGK